MIFVLTICVVYMLNLLIASHAQFESCVCGGVVAGVCG